MNNLRNFLGVLALLGLTACSGVRAGNPEPPTGRASNVQVTGQLVQGNRSIEPASTTEVKLDGPRTYVTVTNEKGEFVFDDVGEGEYTIITHIKTKEKYKNYPAEVTRVMVKIKSVHIGRVAIPGVIAGTAQLSGNENSLGIDVFVPGTSYIAKTDETGDYLMLNMAPGNYRVHASKPGYDDQEVTDVTVVAGAVTLAPPMVLTKGNFSGLTPTVVSAVPSIAERGDSVLLSGSNFGGLQGDGKLLINGNEVPVNTWSDTQIGFIMPAGHEPGLRALTVRRSGLLSNGIQFGIRPSVVSITPVATGDDLVTVSGFNFGSNAGGISVSGPASASPTVTGWFPETVTFAVPANIPADFYTVALTNGLTATEPDALQVIPSVIDVWPREATVGTLVTITATNLGQSPTTDAVVAGDASAYITHWSTTEIQFYVEPWALPGTGTVTVKSAGAIDATRTITVLPFIAVVDYHDIANKSRMRISGANFGPTQGTVSLQANPAYVEAWNPYFIDAWVDAETEPGPQSLTVSNEGVNSAQVFTPVWPVITSAAIHDTPSGVTVEVLGRNFGHAVGTIGIAGVEASASEWSMRRLIATPEFETPAGYQDIVVTVAGKSSDPFAALLPWRLLPLAPSMVKAGDFVTLETNKTFQRVMAVSAGENHSCATTTEGAVHCWGFNSTGAIAVPGSFHFVPVTLPTLTAGVRYTVSGKDHTCALLVNGGVKCWGRNAYGQLGDGSTSPRAVPVDVIGLSNPVTALTSGNNHVCALYEAGELACWGYQYTTSAGSILALPETDIVQAVSGGGDRTCAVLSTGVVKCWGANNGSNTSTVSGLSGASDVKAAPQHACALTNDGGVKCWGNNQYGQLGNGTTTYSASAADVTGLGADVISIGVGADHSCAVTAENIVKCWGRNHYGQVGDGTVDGNILTPQTVIQLSGTSAIVDGGARHTCAVSSANLHCWGFATWGQMGDGSPGDRMIPADVITLGSGVTAIKAGNGFSCALTTEGGVKCWGMENRGNLGDGSGFSQFFPKFVSGLTSGGVALDVGRYHACAVLDSGGIKCWGSNDHGQLGDGTTTDRGVPVDVLSFTNDAIAVATGDNHTCALTSLGGVKCWGYSNFGQTGDGTTGDIDKQRLSPVDVIGLSSGVKAIAAAAEATCALLETGAVKCWGSSYYIGDNAAVNRLSPVDVPGLATGVKQIDGGSQMCAVKNTGELICWDRNTYPISTFGKEVLAVAVGGRHFCALLQGGNLQCWGLNTYGQVGNGETLSPQDRQETPTNALGLSSGIKAVSAGDMISCALTVEGGAKCWGVMHYGMHPARQPLGLGCPTIHFGTLAIPATCEGNKVIFQVPALPASQYPIKLINNDLPSNRLYFDLFE